MAVALFHDDLDGVLGNTEGGECVGLGQQS